MDLLRQLQCTAERPFFSRLLACHSVLDQPCLCAVVVTMGPAIRNLVTFNELLDEGISAVRFDMSLGQLQEHTDVIDMVLQASKQRSKLCAFCLDVSGHVCQVMQPYRTKDSGWREYDQAVVIHKGQDVVLTARQDATMHIPEVRRTKILRKPVALQIYSASASLNTRNAHSISLARRRAEACALCLCLQSKCQCLPDFAPTS